MEIALWRSARSAWSSTSKALWLELLLDSLSTILVGIGAESIVFFMFFFFRNLIAAKESWESLGKSIFVILILRCLKFWVPNFGCGSDFDLHELLLIPPAFRIRFSWKVLWVRWTFAGYHCELWKYLWTRSLNGRSAWCCMGSLFDSWAKR